MTHDVELMNELVRQGMRPSLAVLVVTGKVTQADALAKQKLEDAADALRALPKNEWPAIDVQWDLTPAHFYWSLDHSSPALFAQDFADADLAQVDIDELHGKLAVRARRIGDPFSADYLRKTASLVAHLQAGGLVTPPLLRLKSGHLSFEGGYHRFGWARYRRQRTMPILILPAEKPSIQALVPSVI